MKKQYENPDMEIMELQLENGGILKTLNSVESAEGDSGDWGSFTK